MSSLTTHVLDAVAGEPAVGVRAELCRSGGADWHSIGDGRTDADGRIKDLAPAGLEPGIYRIVFSTAEYFRAAGVTGFYPEVAITFEITDERHYHVPLLLSPYAFSTYRGS